MKPLVSICIPVYGVEKYIERCCRSLFEQTYSNIEFVFVNDCTPDNSIEIIKRLILEYPNRKEAVKIINHNSNKGLSGARNTAIKEAKGKYLMHVDSDDFLDLNVVQNLVETALKENADIVQYDMRYIFPTNQYIIHEKIPNNKLQCINDTLIYKIKVCVCGALYETKLYRDNEIYFIEGLNFGEDYVTKPRLLYFARKIVHCDGCYYNYVQYNTSSYSLSYKSKNIDDLIRAVSILKDFFISKPDYMNYKNHIEMAHLYVKIKLLISICLHKKTVGNRLDEVANLFLDIVPNKSFPLSYQIILWLAKHKLYYILDKYINCGFKIKQIFKNKAQ